MEILGGKLDGYVVVVHSSSKLCMTAGPPVSHVLSFKRNSSSCN